MTRDRTSSAPGEPTRLEQFVVNRMALEAFDAASFTARGALGTEWVEFHKRDAQVGAPVELPKAEAPSDFNSVLSHYSRRLDSRLLFPLLAAPSREAALNVLQPQWQWFVKTLITMTTLASESESDVVCEDEPVAESVTAELLAGARRAGDESGVELRFILNTFRAACEMGRSIQSAAPENYRQQDVENGASFVAYCNVYALGVILLRASACAPECTPSSLALAMEFARAGAVHAYAHVRQAIEFRQPPEPEYTPVALDEEDHRLAATW
jgi:hypothetical protein